MALCVGFALFLPLAAPGSASALSLMVEDLGPPGSAINARAHETSRYMGATYERRIVNVTTWDGSFDWKGQVGPYVDGARANGLNPYLAITADPGWSKAESRIPSAAKMQSACSKAATEFQGRVFDYAVWNEPNLTNVGNLSPSDYLNLYKACRTGIKSVSATANVYFGEFSTAASGWGGMNACQYFRAATPVNANMVTEGVAIHPYQFSSSPKTKTGTECNGIGRLGDWQAENTAAKNANALKTASGGSAPIVISEFGYCGERPPYAPGYPANAAQPACPQNAGGTANVKDEATRATWVKEAFEWASSFPSVAIFDYHTVVKRPAGNYVGNTGYLWESGIINQEDGSWTPSVNSLRSAVKPPTLIHKNLLTNASFAQAAAAPPSCGTAPGWGQLPNGGTQNTCAYADPSKSQQGNSYLEFNANVSQASVYQDVALFPQPGESYTFSTWVRTPEGTGTGTIAVFAVNGAGGVTDSMSTKFTTDGTWKQVSVPLTVTQAGAQKIRVQVYEETPNRNFDLVGTQLHKNLLTNASFAQAAGSGTCGGHPGWGQLPNGGTQNTCAYADPSKSQQGNSYLEFNANVSQASVYQDVALFPQPGESYTFSTWVRTPEGTGTGTIAVFAVNGAGGVTDSMSTKFTTDGTWKQVSVPLTVTQAGAQKIRVQVYEETPNRNFDLVGTQLR